MSVKALEWQHQWDRSGLYLQSIRRGKPLMLLLHGIGDWSDSLRPLGDALSEHVDCLIPDLSGHGFSPRKNSYRVRDYAEDLQRLINNLAEPIYLYGHSLGGLLALWLAGTFPDQVRGCVLEDPPLFHLSASIHQRPDIVSAFSGMYDILAQNLQPHDALIALEQLFPGRPLSVLRQRALDLQRMDPKIWDPVLSDQLCFGLPNPLSWPEIAHPLHILLADPKKGAAMIKGDEEPLRASCSQMTLATVQGAGHRIHRKHLGEVVANCRKILFAAG